MFLPRPIPLLTRSELPGNATTSWVLEPDGRGTFGILRSCIITLALCVYTAIHLNIPGVQDTKRTRWLRKAKWVTIAMFAPEVVVYVAWCQRQQVLELHDVLSRKLDQEPETGRKRKHAWTMTHSWYAKMGGFVIDTARDTESEPYVFGSPWVSVDSIWILETIASEGWLPDLPKSYIDDKSKADGIAKTLVIVQSSWMILQCVMRWTSGLTVTSLELNTLAHAVCALLIYVLWWQKPLDIDHPTTLTGEWTYTLAALLWMRRKPKTKFDVVPRWIRARSRPFAVQRYTELSGPEASNAVPGWIRARSRSSAVQRYAELSGPEANNVVWVDLDMLQIPPEYRDSGTTDLLRIFNIASQQYSMRKFDPPSKPNTQPTLHLSVDEIVLMGTVGVRVVPRFHVDRHVKNVILDKDCLQRWKLVWDTRKSWVKLDLHGFTEKNAQRKRADLVPWGLQGDEVIENASFVLNARSAAYKNTLRVQNWVLVDPREGLSAAPSLIVFLACGVAYGGIHAAAWNNYYSTIYEEMMWKTSCICVASYSAAIGFLATGLFWMEHNYEKKYGYENYESLEQREAEMRTSTTLVRFRNIIRSFSPHSMSYRPWLFWPGAVLLGTATLLYLAARVLLVVEGFISLRDVPLSVYQTPDWTRYLPHL
ncbi:hypothetical protein B0T21DRAFT_366457 [Apiosordaria backusii]|uniref:Uncharacterized protein n=1 Tax=Apiosordaria backusii TaxID=314023 RepID=A0AA40EHL1_9PEZI|nr:hypothetical protein B0T21DRAFT_366457 [Apiosordaria backusii]